MRAVEAVIEKEEVWEVGGEEVRGVREAGEVRVRALGAEKEDI
jgi:hypothetical protein